MVNKTKLVYLLPYVKSNLIRRSKSIIILMALLFLFSLPVLSQSSYKGLPGFIIPDGVGVNTHFITGGNKDHDMIASAGIKVIRQDFLWSAIEKEKGKYNWSPYDSLVSELDHLGIRLLVTLNLNNPIYTDGRPIRWAATDPADIEGYAKFASAAALRYKSSHCIWEIWNEPNGKHTWAPCENATQYSVLALAACKAIRDVVPNATIIAPAMAGIHYEWLDTLFSSGLLKYIDGVSIHPYRDGPPPLVPESVGKPLKKVQDLVAKYAPAGKKIYVVSGEWGYTTCLLPIGVSLQTQADYAARMQLFNLYSGIPLTIWYDWKNDGQDLYARGQNRGLVTHDLNLKPSYAALSTLTHELSGYYVYGRFNPSDTSDYVLILKNSKGVVKLAAWTQGKPHEVSIKLAEVSFPNTSKIVWWIDGNTKSGKVNVKAKGFPVYLNNTPKYCSTFPPLPLPKYDIDSFPMKDTLRQNQ